MIGPDKETIMILNLETKLTPHAQKRSQQRGIKNWVIEFILDNADKTKHVGRGSISQFISERKIGNLLKRNILKPKEASFLTGVVVIDNGENITTVFHKKMRMKT